jgi:hypothetical protein
MGWTNPRDRIVGLARQDATALDTGWKNGPSRAHGLDPIQRGSLRPRGKNPPAIGLLGGHEAPEAAEDQDMPVILRDAPAPLNWGWFSNEDPRMHLQTLNRENRGRNELKAWLEKGGRRVIEWASQPAAAKTRASFEELVRKNREAIEDAWIALMIDKGWLSLRLEGHVLIITAYPGHDSFRRMIDLKAEFAGTYESLSEDDLGLDPELSAVVLWKKRPEAKRQHLRLVGRLWKD